SAEVRDGACAGGAHTRRTPRSVQNRSPDDSRPARRADAAARVAGVLPRDRCPGARHQSECGGAAIPATRRLAAPGDTTLYLACLPQVPRDLRGGAVAFDAVRARRLCVPVAVQRRPRAAPPLEAVPARSRR